MALGTQYAAGPALSMSHAGEWKVNAVDISAIADLDDGETLYTADFTLTGDEQAAMFVVVTSGDTTSAHTAAVSLMHTASHALAVTKGLIRGKQSAPPVPETTVTLDMGIAADRNVVLHVNPNAVDSALAQLSKVISLKFVGAGSLSNLVVRVALLTSNLRHQK